MPPKAAPLTRDLDVGEIIHGPGCTQYLVLAHEWDPLSGHWTYRVAGITDTTSDIWATQEGTPMAELPFTGMVGRIYPATKLHFHEAHT